MNRTRFAAALVLSAPLLVMFGSLAVGCGDDEVFRATDGGGFDSGPTTEAGPNPPLDGGDGSAPSPILKPSLRTREVSRRFGDLRLDVVFPRAQRLAGPGGRPHV